MIELPLSEVLTDEETDAIHELVRSYLRVQAAKAELAKAKNNMGIASGKLYRLYLRQENIDGEMEDVSCIPDTFVVSWPEPECGTFLVRLDIEDGTPPTVERVGGIVK